MLAHWLLSVCYLHSREGLWGVWGTCCRFFFFSPFFLNVIIPYRDFPHLCVFFLPDSAIPLSLSLSPTDFIYSCSLLLLSLSLYLCVFKIRLPAFLYFVLMPHTCRDDIDIERSLRMMS